jgi:hypothetical protein
VRVPGIAPGTLVRLSDRAFRFGHAASFEKDWGATFKSWRVLDQFTATPAWQNRQQRDATGAMLEKQGGLTIKTWQEMLTNLKFSLVEMVDKEIDDLVLKAESERADALGEIISQNADFIGEFLGLLGTGHAFQAYQQPPSALTGLPCA